MERDLRFTEIFETINEKELSWDSVFVYFFWSDRKALLVADDDGKLAGLITLGSFIAHHDRIPEALNRECLCVMKDSMEKMLFEAEELYARYQIQSDIPVIDCENRICGYITDQKMYFDKRKAIEEKTEEILAKIRNYKNSVYLEKELEAFFHIMSETVLYARNSEAFHKIFSLFDKKIRVSDLADEDYLDIARRTFYQKNSVTDSERDKTFLIFDFEPGNRGQLLEGLGIPVVYDIDRFSREFIYLVENEEFSRLVRITETADYRLRDYVYDFRMAEIKFQRNSLLTNFLNEYMRKNSIAVLLTNTGSVSSLQASSVANGIRGSSKAYHDFIICDLIEQQCNISRAMKGQNIYVLNMAYAVNAKLTQGEKERFANLGRLDSLIERGDYAALEDLYQGDCEIGKVCEYAEELCYQWPSKRRFENDITVYMDYCSQYINIENGIRRTCNQPQKYKNTIFFTGPCFAMGIFVEDGHTIPSLLAGMLKTDGYYYRIANLGGTASNGSSELLEAISPQEGDIIINLICNENMDRINSMFENVVDPSADFDAIKFRKDMFFDHAAHCNRKGNEVIANSIYSCIRPVLKRSEDGLWKYNQCYDVFAPNFSDLHLYGFRDYIDGLQREMMKIPSGAKEIGSIVMNCNPFTIGHQHLVEYALQNCEYLFVFVVQENMSYFHFEDRFAIASLNCKKYKNVSVVPSGNMIVSDITFPEYFKREKYRDVMDIAVDETAIPVSDLRIFAAYIAAALGIRKRFIAEEPFDSVTRQYNYYMKKILSVFHVEVKEIPRKTLSDGETVSASTVRRLFRNRRYEEMRRLLPEETYDYIMKKADQYLKNENDGVRG